MKNKYSISIFSLTVTISQILSMFSHWVIEDLESGYSIIKVAKKNEKEKRESERK